MIREVRYKCPFCGQPINESRTTKDHYFPQSLLNTLEGRIPKDDYDLLYLKVKISTENILMSHKVCNGNKGDNIPTKRDIKNLHCSIPKKKDLLSLLDVLQPYINFYNEMCDKFKETKPHYKPKSVLGKYVNLPCIDHLGNEFLNEKSMCSFYGVPYVNYLDYKTRGISLESSLMNKSKQYTNINKDLRISNKELSDLVKLMGGGVSQKELVNYIKIDGFSSIRSYLNKRTDVYGTVFKDEETLANYWGIPPFKYSKYLDEGFSQKEILINYGLLRDFSKDLYI